MTTLLTPILLQTAVIYLLLRFLPQIKADSVVALVVAVLLGALNAGLGIGLYYVLDEGVTYFFVSFFLRLFFTAGLLIVLAGFLPKLAVRGLWAATMVALGVTIAGMAYDTARRHDYQTHKDDRPYFDSEDRRR